MAWRHMQIVAGLQRLGHDVYYFEITSIWPYDPSRQIRVDDSSYALPHLARVADSFGLGDRSTYLRSYSDSYNECFAPARTEAEDLLVYADAVLKVAGGTWLAKEGLKIGRRVYFGTDPVYHELAWAKADSDILQDQATSWVTMRCS
jgi:hypothetical protein